MTCDRFAHFCFSKPRGKHFFLLREGKEHARFKAERAQTAAGGLQLALF